jgi:hypothetical protein
MIKIFKLINFIEENLFATIIKTFIQVYHFIKTFLLLVIVLINFLLYLK